MQVSDCLIEESKSIKGNYWVYQKPSINFVEKIKSSFSQIQQYRSQAQYSPTPL